MAIQGEQPIARWLDVQLPQLINQHVTNRENRIHQKDMMDQRHQLAKDQADYNSQLRQEELVAKNQLNQLNETRTYLRDQITTNKKSLDIFGVMASDYDYLKDENATGEGKEILTKLGEDITRPLLEDIEAYGNTEEMYRNTSENVDYLNRTLQIQNQLLSGTTRGTQTAYLVEDMNADRKLTVDDFNLFLAQKEEAGEGLTDIERIGFEQTFPKAVEAFNDALVKTAQADKYRAAADATITKNTNAKLAASGIVFDPAKMKSKLDMGSKTLASFSKDEDHGGLDKKFVSKGITYDMSQILLPKDSVTPENVYKSMDMIANNITKAINYGEATNAFMLTSEDGSQVNTYSQLQAAIESNNPQNLRKAMRDFMKATKDFTMKDWHDELDFDGSALSNVTSTGIEHTYFIDLLNYYKQLDLGMIPLENASNNKISSGGFYSSEEEKLANEEIDKLSNELTGPVYKTKSTYDPRRLGTGGAREYGLTDVDLGLYGGDPLAELVRADFDPSSLATFNIGGEEDKRTGKMKRVHTGYDEWGNKVFGAAMEQFDPLLKRPSINVPTSDLFAMELLDKLNSSEDIALAD